MLHSVVSASTITDAGVLSSIPASPHTFMETDHEIFSKVILLLPLIQEGLLSVASESVHEVMVNSLV